MREGDRGPQLVRNMLYKRANGKEGRVCIFWLSEECNIPWKKGRGRGLGFLFSLSAFQLFLVCLLFVCY